MAALRQALIDKISRYRASAPVFRTRDLTFAELEADALAFARRFAAELNEKDVKFRATRDGERLVVKIPQGGRVSVFQASGAMVAKRRLGPLEQPITDASKAPDFEQQAKSAARALELDALTHARERLVFERLWKIRAGSVSVEGTRGRELLCRVVGAFRRELADLPVWGRASVFVEFGGEGLITAAGRDWRRCMDEPFEEVGVIDPEVAADRVLAELTSPGRGGMPTTDYLAPELFALGYFSFPVRRSQGYMQPVYVAKLSGVDRPNPNESVVSQVIVVPAAASAYEPLHTAPAAPPLKLADRARSPQP